MDDEFTRVWERQVNRFLGEPVPSDVREHGERVVADVLAAAVAGSVVPAIESVARDATFPDGPSSILGTTRRVAPAEAALVNTAAAIAQEVEEGHDTGGHVGASIVAGGLPIAERAGVGGETFVDACVRTYEVCVRLERAIFAMKDRMNRALPWLVRNPHSTWTTVGPAVTSALCLGADADELRETVRIAANLAVVSMHDPYAEGAPSRNFTAGFSAQVGVTAALTAAAGLRGSLAAVEAVYDPFEDLLADGFASQFDSLGEEWVLTESYSKPYPSCRYTHPPLDALREAVDGEDVDPHAVDRIVVHTFENATDMDHADPETMTSAKFSTPYVLARYLRDGKVDLDSFGPEAIADRAVGDLAERVSLVPDAAFEAAFPDSWGARVEVELTDGTALAGAREHPRGDHRDPLSPATLAERNRALLAHGLPADRADAALEALDAVAARSVSETVAALRPRAGGDADRRADRGR
jgi:2-methylcitrate dehydratase PrpD